MARPRTVPREGDLFVADCPNCGKRRLLKNNPGPRRNSPCTSCHRKGKGVPKFQLAETDRARYEAGVSAAQIARDLGVDAGTVLRALRRDGVACRTMSEAVQLLDNVTLAATNARELRASGEMAQRLSAGHQGIPLADWDGFRSEYWARVRSSKAWGEWRSSVYERDGYHCVECGTASTRQAPLEPHHIRTKARHPELMFEVSNGVTLCSTCHRAISGKEDSLIDHFDQLVRHGRTVIPVDPRNTSRTCPECGHVAKENRVTQEKFHCVTCGHTAHADLVGATNVLRAGLARRETPTG